MIAFDLADGLASCVVAVWLISGFALNVAKWFDNERVRTISRHVWAEVRPFYLSAAVYGMAYDLATGKTGWLTLLGDAALVGSWWLHKDIDDDDRWKRRKRKAADKVQALASGRLVSVPASS